MRAAQVHSISSSPAGSNELEHNSAASELPSRTTLRLVTYNIAHGRGLAESNWQGGSRSERMQRLDSIADMLREIDADIVVLNEVDFASSWSGQVNQAEYLAKRCSFDHWVEQCNMDFRIGHWNWRFGNAILSKHAISGAERIEMPGYSTVERLAIGQKQALRATIEYPAQPINVIGVHLCQRSSAVRLESAAKLIQLARSSPRATLVLGDFNSSLPSSQDAEGTLLDSAAIAELDRSQQFEFQPTTPSASPEEKTFSSEKPDRIIDWILLPRHAKFLNYRVLDTKLSDHRPVVAEVAWQIGVSK